MGEHREYDGDCFKGNYVKGKLEGGAMHSMNNGETQESEWKNGKI